MEPEISAADKVAAAFSDTSVAENVTESAPAEVISAPPTTGGHPAWNEILQAVPTAFHEAIRPTLEKWDKGVQEKLAEYTQKYSPYDPIVGQDPTKVTAGIQLVQALEADPYKFYQQLAEHYKFQAAQEAAGQGQPSSDVVDLAEYSEDLATNPQFKMLQEQQQKLQAYIEQQQQLQEKAAADAWLETTRNQVSAKYQGVELDWDFILNKASMLTQQGSDPTTSIEKAAEAFVGLVDKYRTPVANLTAPPVVAPSGSVPVSPQQTIGQMSDQDRKAMLVQALTQSFKS